MKYKKRNKGVSTLAAVMMIIIMGILGAAFVSLLDTEQYGYLNSYEAAQSFYNANAGVEWGQKQQASTGAPIPFAGGTISVSLAGNTITATGTTNRGERVIQVQLASAAPVIPPAEGCESYIVSDSSSYSNYTTTYDNPSGGVGDAVYVKVTSTNLTGCSGGTVTLNKAEIKLENIKCPRDDVKYDTISNWSCSGPLTDAGCTDYYEYTFSFQLPSGWSDTSVNMEIKLEDGGNKFKGMETLIIGQGDCSSVKFYSDSGYTTEVDPWEFEKAGTYYMRVITDNLNGNAPRIGKGELEIRDFADDRIFRDRDFFSLNGTQNITCGGTAYSYGSYEGSFTVPDSAPGGGSDWISEPTADWYYTFKIDMEANGGNCKFKYQNSLKILASSGGGGGGGSPPPGPLDEAASEGSATQTTPGTPDWHGAQGGNDQFIIKLINETAVDLVITDFDLSCSTAQPNLKHVQSSTAANGWNKQRIWNGNQSLPTGTVNLNQGGAADRTIPANDYIIIDDFHFQNNINPGTFTLIIYFQGGVSSTLTFSLP